MDREKFTESSPGKLVEISIPKKDWAFVPHPLPPNWKFPEGLWPLLSEAKVAVARLDGIAQSLPNPQLLLRPLQSREALRSSSLEGTYATPEELLLFEFQPREPTSDTDPANAFLEVANYISSLRHGLELLNELPICLRLIKGLHQVLLTGVRGRNKAPGDFRKNQVHIGSDYRFIPPPPNYLDSCLDSFERALNTDKSPYDPLVQCYIFHYQLETIHPFLDGNGRVGRVLLSIMIFKLCKLSMPWLYMSAYFERYKDEYIDNLFRVSSEGDWEAWIEFCLRGTVSQATDSIARCAKLNALKDEFHASTEGTGPRDHSIIEGLFSTPMLNVTQTAKRYDVSYPTARSDINRLMKLKILTEMPDKYPKVYYCPSIFRIAYREPDEPREDGE